MLLETATVGASLNIGVWTGARLDRRVSLDVASREGVDQRVGSYKKVLVRAEELNQIKAISQSARLHFYKASLPWKDGLRIMPVDAANAKAGDIPHLVRYMQEHGNYLRTFTSAVDVFLAKYDGYVLAAARELRGMYDASDYPSKEELAGKFYMDLDITPIPTAGDFRISLVGREIDAIKTGLSSRMDAALRNSVKDLWLRLYERVCKVHEAVADPAYRFRDTLIEHTRDLCEDLAILNVAGDQELEAVRVQVLNDLASLDTARLRVDNTDPDGYRAQAARKAESIMAKVRNMGGVV